MRINIILYGVFVALLVVFFSTEAGATYYWIHGTSGSDSVSCANASTSTPTDPGAGHYRQTIQGGLTCLSPGDTLYLKAAGNSYLGQRIAPVYNSPGVCSAECMPGGLDASHPTVISAAPGQERQVIVGGNAQGAFAWPVGFINYVTIRGFVINGGNQDYNSGSNKYIINGACMLDRCDLVDQSAGQPGAIGAGLPFGFPRGWVIENNEMYGAYNSCLYILADYTVRGNDIHNCGSSNQDHAIYLHHRNLLEYNTIHNNRGNAMQGFSSYPDSTHPKGCIENVEFPCNWPDVVRYNYTYDNAGMGIVLQASQGGGDQIYGNVSYNDGNSPEGGHGISWWGETTTDQKVFNNTVIKNGINNNSSSTWYCFDGYGGWVYNNLCVIIGAGGWGSYNLYGGQHAASNNTTTNSSPFVNIGARNFQITVGSVPYNAGLDVGTSWPTNAGPFYGYGPPFNIDASGVARPQGGAWDTGACEGFSGAGVCPNLQSVTPPVNLPTITINQPAGCAGTSSACTTSSGTVTITGTSTPGG